jgi:hypothetical protein
MKLRESVFQLQDTYGDKEDNYTAVYHLMPHLEDMEHEDLFQYAMVQLLGILCNSSFVTVLEIIIELVYFKRRLPYAILMP